MNKEETKHLSTSSRITTRRKDSSEGETMSEESKWMLWGNVNCGALGMGTMYALVRVGRCKIRHQRDGPIGVFNSVLVEMCYTCSGLVWV